MRSRYESDVTEREIRNLIEWAITKNPQPCGLRLKARNYGATNFYRVTKPERVTREHAIANAEKWLGDFRCDECDLWHVSPWRPLEDWRVDPVMLFAALYDKADFINVVTDFTIERQKDGKEKANPKGAGKSLLRDDWMRTIRQNGVPQSKAGAWIRPNPVKQHGTGTSGAPCDADVTRFQFCLLESDDLPFDLQLSLWARVPLPIVAIIDSGGRSAHAWVMLNCSAAEEYRAKVNRIFALLARFRICQSNKNPSRLSRVPGVQRTIGKRDGGAQRLLYLNPEPTESPIFQRSRLR